MATEILQKTGTLICFADFAADFGDGHGIAGTEVQLSLATLADAAARQSAKADLGAVRAGQYAVRVGIEMNVAPVAGAAVYFYWSASESVTAGTGNDGGCSGADAAYQAGSEAEWVKQLTLIGVLSLTADADTVIQIATVGRFSPPSRYGQVVVWNEGGQAFEGDDVEMFVALVPIIDESQ